MRAMSGPRRALGEPLLQFIVIGALLFAGYRLVHPERPATVEGNRVELTADDVRQLEIVWTAQWHRAPTPDELQDSWRAGSARRSSTAKRSRSASSAATRSSSAGWRRRWSSWPTTFRPCALLRSRSCAPGIRAIPPGSRILVVVPSGTCTFPRTAAGSCAAGRRACACQARPHARRCTRALGHRRRVHVPGVLRRSHAGAGGSHLRQPLRRAVRQLPVGTWQGPIESGLVGIWCSSRPRRRSRPGLRRDRGRDPGGVDGGSTVGSATSRLRGDEGSLRGAIGAVPRTPRPPHRLLPRRHERSIESRSRIRSNADAGGAGAARSRHSCERSRSASGASR